MLVLPLPNRLSVLLRRAAPPSCCRARRFWDYGTGHSFFDTKTRVQPGSLESEAGIFAMAFDQSGSRLITGEADKSIKIWEEDASATPETHPIDMKAWTDYVRAHKRY